MSEENTSKLNRLVRSLPDGLLVTAAWLEARGYYGSLRKRYVHLGWLEQPAPRVYRRPGGTMRWEQPIISLQTLMEFPVVVGGRTALELQGYAHFLSAQRRQVHLYGRTPAPAWLHKLPTGVRFVCHNNRSLFPSDPPTRGVAALDRLRGERDGATDARSRGDLVAVDWGQWDWPLTLSSPERAVLELLDELPGRESFHMVDKLVEGLVNLSPGRLQELLEECASVKVKRLFFFFADRHAPPWLRRLDRKRIDLGKGKRSLVRGGTLDRTYGITVPKDLHAVS